MMVFIIPAFSQKLRQAFTYRVDPYQESSAQYSWANRKSLCCSGSSLQLPLKCLLVASHVGLSLNGKSVKNMSKRVLLSLCLNIQICCSCPGLSLPPQDLGTHIVAYCSADASDPRLFLQQGGIQFLETKFANTAMQPVPFDVVATA